MKLASLNDIILLGSFPDNFDKNLLLLYLDCVSADIEEFCNRTFTYDAVTEYFTADSTNEVVLNYYPVDSSADFTLSTNECGTWEELTEDEDYWVNYTDGIVTFKNKVYAYEPNNIKVEYSGGYDEISINTTPTTRLDDTAYAVNARITVAGTIYRCTTAGTSDESPPTFDSGVSATTTDNTVVWTEDSGYTEVLDVPKALKMACIKQTVFELRRRKELGVLSVSTPDGSKTNMVADMLPEVIKTLKRSYRTMGHSN